MNKTVGILLIVYSLLLAGLVFFVRWHVPALGEPIIATGLVGSLFCLVWGTRIVAGHQGKAPALLTLVPMTFVLLSQTVIAWTSEHGESPGLRPAALPLTGMLVLSLGMLMRIAYAGVVFNQEPASPPKSGGTTPTLTARPRTQTD